MNTIEFAGVYVRENDKILLVQEAHAEAYGLWSFPLGRVEPGEEPSEAAIREAKEETGLDIELTGYEEVLEIPGVDLRSTREFDRFQVVLHLYDGALRSETIHRGDDVLDARWFAPSEIEELPLRGRWVRQLIR